MLGDPETANVDAWRDTPADVAWTTASPDVVLRLVDRFHGVPDAPAWANSWAEWLYFNGRSNEASFYLTFLVGPTHRERRADLGRAPADRTRPSPGGSHGRR